MSAFGEILFQGTPFLRWTLGPLAILSALTFAVLVRDARGISFILLVAIEIALVLLALVAFAPRRFRWAGRALAGMVFLVYVVYFVNMVLTKPGSFWPFGPRSGSGGFQSILGLLVIGYPSALYALLGRFSWRKPAGSKGRESAA